MRSASLHRVHLDRAGLARRHGGRVHFERAEGGTRVQLRHRLFERLGDAGETSRDQFGGGWPAVLAAYAAVASRRDAPGP
jgi:hypothetical protein